MGEFMIFFFNSSKMSYQNIFQRNKSLELMNILQVYTFISAVIVCLVSDNENEIHMNLDETIRKQITLILS